MLFLQWQLLLLLLAVPHRLTSPRHSSLQHPREREPPRWYSGTLSTLLLSSGNYQLGRQQATTASSWSMTRLTATLKSSCPYRPRHSGLRAPSLQPRHLPLPQRRQGRNAVAQRQAHSRRLPLCSRKKRARISTNSHPRRPHRAHRARSLRRMSSIAKTTRTTKTIYWNSHHR